jgi:hypothetical protein
MLKRVWLGLVTVFWVTMIALLWRSEFGSRQQPGSSVPPEMVWKKILTAPDYSQLVIRYHTNTIGSCRWRPDVGQELATGARMDEDEPVEGMIPDLSHYTLDLDGYVTLPDFPVRTRFSSLLKLSTNFSWLRFDGRAVMRPDTYELSASATEQTVSLRVDAGGDQFTRVFRFSELQNPQKLLLELGGPMLPLLASSLGMPIATNQISATSFGLHWEARHDWLTIGGNRVRAYRLQARPLGRYRITLYVSPVGEILRAELPGDLVLLNEALSGLRQMGSHD